MKARILEAKIQFVEQPFNVPLQLSTGTITVITEASVEVRLRVGSKEAVGKGSIYLSDLWAWPDPEFSHEKRDEALRDLCEQIAKDLDGFCGGEEAHPLELGMRLHDRICESEAHAPIPMLARALCASPFDAAIHDAVGQALACSAFELYREDQTFPSVDKYFKQGAASAIRKALRTQKPHPALPAWYIINKDDPLTDSLHEWVVQKQYRCFKIKLMGQDNEVDARRTAEVYRALLAMGVEKPRLSVDSNEANPDAASVFDYLGRLSACDWDGFGALEYLEQPTARDILKHPQDWRAVTERKPVLLDEGLTSLDLLDEVLRQGWSGICLKTCKGHSFALVAAAWAHEHGLKISVQDLTNPGFSLIHGALLAAHLPTINGAELNSPQFTPAANEPWMPRLKNLFAPENGFHQLPKEPVIGLGSTL